MTAILCEGLTKHYGTVVGLQDLDLAVPDGAVFGFLGPNGAGKTTTIKLLTGLSRPTSGRASVAGYDVTAGNTEMRARIGYLAEEPAFYGWMTGEESSPSSGGCSGCAEEISPDVCARFLRWLIWARRLDDASGATRGGCANASASLTP